MNDEPATTPATTPAVPPSVVDPAAFTMIQHSDNTPRETRVVPGSRQSPND